MAEPSLELHLLVNEDAIRRAQIHHVPATALERDDRVDGGDFLVLDDQVSYLSSDDGSALLEGEPVTRPLSGKEDELSFRLQG